MADKNPPINLKKNRNPPEIPGMGWGLAAARKHNVAQLRPLTDEGKFGSIPLIPLGRPLRYRFSFSFFFLVGAEITGPGPQRQRESEMAAAGGGAGGSSPSGTKTKRLKIAVIHPDLGIGKPPLFLLPVEPPWSSVSYLRSPV